MLLVLLMLAVATSSSAPLTTHALIAASLAVVAIAAVYLARFLRSPWKPVRPHPFSGYLVAFCLILFPASLAGLTPIPSLAISIGAVLCFVAFFAIREAFSSASDGFLSPRGFAAVLASGCTLAVLFRVITHLTGHSGSFLPWYCLAPPDLNAGQPFDRVFSLLLVSALPFVIAGSVVTSAHKRILFAISSALVGVGILLSFSRAAWIALAAQIVVLIALHRRARRWIPGVVLGCMLIACLVPAVAARGRSMTSLHEGSNSSRLEFWAAGIEMLAESPFLGCGPGAFGEAYERLGDREPPKTVPCPHNLLLRIGTECGLPALCIFIGVAFSILRQLMNKGETATCGSADWRSTCFRFAGGIALIGILVFSLFHL